MVDSLPPPESDTSAEVQDYWCLPSPCRWDRLVPTLLLVDIVIFIIVVFIVTKNRRLTATSRVRMMICKWTDWATSARVKALWFVICRPFQIICKYLISLLYSFKLYSSWFIWIKIRMEFLCQFEIWHFDLFLGTRWLETQDLVVVRSQHDIAWSEETASYLGCSRMSKNSWNSSLQVNLHLIF